MKIGEVVRQGDVLIVRVSSKSGVRVPIPRENGRVVLAHGGATGHAHAIADPGVVAYMLGDEFRLDVPDNATVLHEEHTRIELDPGTYRVIRQREYLGEDDYVQISD